MSTKSELLNLLNENINSFVSGQEIADKLGLSRNAIWKAVNSLKDMGYNIDSQSRNGYRLIDMTDILSESFIKEGVQNTPASACKITVRDIVDSTNNMAKSFSISSLPQVVIANEQIKGRGRLGRTFYSPASKGLYMSIAFRPNLNLDDAMLVTTASAVAVCKAIESVTGLKPQIKWVNDIYLNGKKICGILTEAESNFETGQIEKIIVGIGLNCFYSNMPDELREIASFLENPQKEFTRNDMACAILSEFFAIIENFDRIGIVREYKRRSFILGEQIMIFNPAVARSIGRPLDRLNDGIRARAIDIDTNGGLVVEYLEGYKMRNMETLTSGEITIRKIR